MREERRPGTGVWLQAVQQTRPRCLPGLLKRRGLERQERRVQQQGQVLQTGAERYGCLSLRSDESDPKILEEHRRGELRDVGARRLQGERPTHLLRALLRERLD